MSHRFALKTFRRREDGALTSFGLFLIIAMVCVGGLAIDVSNAVMVRTHLQTAADSAAHAAIIARETASETDAKNAAVAVAQVALPAADFGDTISPNDIQFGTWDAATRTFTPQAGSREAVLVNTQRLQSRNNGLTTYFLRFAGLWNMDVVSQSIFETYYPTCFREGFVADQRVDVQSNNTYRAGFCIHSNSHVEMNNNNLFEDGVIVSMPSETDVVMPVAGWTSNTGIENALRSGAYRIRILQRIDDIIAGYDNPASQFFRPDYLTLPVQTVNLSTSQQLTAATWQTGHVHSASCSGNQRLRIRAGETIRGGVIDTNCVIVLGSSVTLEDVLIISTSTDLRAIDGAAGVVLGLDDNCTAGGGVQIVTRGGVRFTANLHMHGVQILADDMIDFEANGNGVQGVSLVTSGEIDSTSNMEMGFCNGVGMENNFDAEYFRMAY